MNINDYLQLMSDRYSVRKFSDEPVAQEQIDAILKAAQLSPTARNAQSFRLCVVQTPEGLEKIDKVSKCRYGAPVVIIAAFDTKVSAKGLGFESGDFGNVDATIALTNMANAATAAGLGSCWVGAYDPKEVREEFNVPDDCMLVDMLMVGHPAADCAPGPRHTATVDMSTLVVNESF